MYSHKQRAQELADRIKILEAADLLHSSPASRAELARTYNALVRELERASGRKFDLSTSEAYRGKDPALMGANA